MGTEHINQNFYFPGCSWKLGGLFLILWRCTRNRDTVEDVSNFSTSFGETNFRFFWCAGDSHLVSGILPKGIYLWIFTESIFLRGKRVLVFLLCYFSDATLHIFGLYLIYIGILGLFFFFYQLRHMNNS